MEQWNKIAEDTVVGSGAFQSEGLLYMAYESTAVYDAVVSLEGGYRPLEPAFRVSKQASPDAAVVEAAYRILRHYFPSSYASLDASYAEALAAIPNGPAKVSGQQIGLVAANQVIRARSVDGLTMPIAITSSFPTRPPGPGVWRLTPPYQSPQTPWVGNVRPFVLQSPSQFLPPPPPALSSPEWVAAFDEVEAYGGANSTVRTPDQTNIAQFWSANVIRQYNEVARDVADRQGLSLVKTARLAAMVNVIGADAGIAFMNAKYHYLFWRPVTAIDPTSVSPDGYGPVPGPDDGNPATVEQPGWRPLLVTPNHPEYPSAHGTLAAAESAVLTAFLGTSADQHRRPRLRPQRPHRQPQRGAPLRNRRRHGDGGRKRPRLGGSSLPLLRRGRQHARLQGRRLRPPARVPTRRLVVRLTAKLSQSGHATGAPRLLLAWRGLLTPSRSGRAGGD